MLDGQVMPFSMIKRRVDAQVGGATYVGSEFNPAAATAGDGEAKAAPAPKKKAAPKAGAGARTKQADGGAKSKASKPARAVARKTTTPRKAGGS